MKTKLRSLLIPILAVVALLAVTTNSFAANGLTTFAQDKVSNALMQGSGLGAPGTWYLALYTAVPTVAGGGTEASYPGYVRLAIPATSTYWSAASGTTTITVTNAQLEQFAAAGSGASATLVGWAIFDASTGGNMWFFGTMTSTTVSPGLVVQFAASAISLIWNSTTP